MLSSVGEDCDFLLSNSFEVVPIHVIQLRWQRARARWLSKESFELEVLTLLQYTAIGVVVDAMVAVEEARDCTRFLVPTALTLLSYVSNNNIQSNKCF